MKSQNWIAAASWKAFFTFIASVAIAVFVINFDDNRIQSMSSSTTVKVWMPANALIEGNTEFDKAWRDNISVSLMNADAFKKAFGNQRVIVRLEGHSAIYGTMVNGVFFTTEIGFGTRGDSATYLGNGWVRVDGTGNGIVWNSIKSAILAFMGAAGAAVVYLIFYLLWIEKPLEKINDKNNRMEWERIERAMPPCPSR